MNRKLITVLLATVPLTGSSLLPAAAGQNTTTPASQTPAQNNNTNHPRRAQAKLDGFDLAPEKASANQIGGASRSVGSGGKLVLYAPHKGLVFSLRPSFWWQGDATAAYRVRIQDMTGQFSWDRPVTGDALAYPADAPPLEPGRTYLWRVVPDSPLLGPPPPAAMIVVMADADRSQLEAAVNQIQGSGVDAGIARARLYFDHRLWYDAVMEYNGLIAQYPDQGQLYGLRGVVYDQLPATQALADADYSHSK
jgi:Domain of Unknown Function (DUF928)